MSNKKDKALEAYPVCWTPLGDDNRGFRIAYEKGYEQATADAIERAAKWLRDHVNVPAEVRTDENGEPYAEDYIKYAQERLETANAIIEDFKNAMKDE